MIQSALVVVRLRYIDCAIEVGDVVPIHVGRSEEDEGALVGMSEGLWWDLVQE